MDKNITEISKTRRGHRIFKIDVGNASKEEAAEQYVKKLQEKYRNMQQDE